MSETLAIFGNEYSNVAGIKVKNTAGNELTYTLGGGGGSSLGTKSITANGTYNASSDNLDGYSSVIVNVPTGGDTPDLQTKAVSFTPTETAQTQTVTPDTGKDGLSSVEVSVGAISSTYVGSEIARRSSTDLTASGATVTVPAGYYSADVSKSVATTTLANPSISIDSNGTIWATVNQSEGYLPLSASQANYPLATQAAKTVTPTKSSQTAVAAERYTTGAVTVAAIPAAYQDVTGVTAAASDVVSGKDIVDSSGTVVHGSLVIQHYYTSANDPTASDGADGDIWLKVVS